MSKSKYNVVYSQHIKSLIHILTEVHDTGKSERVSFMELKNVGARNTYKAYMTFTESCIPNGAAAHLVPVARLYQHIMKDHRFAWMRNEPIVLKMNAMCELVVMKKSVADALKKKDDRMSMTELYNAADLELAA